MESKSVKYPVGIQDFENLRKDGYLYIDKTDIIYNLVNGGKYFFLSRPRRFGKSLLLSTLKAYFEGKKTLFKGLAIYQLEKEWIKYPVFLLSLARTDAKDPKSVESLLMQQFKLWEKKYGIDKPEENLASRFSDLIIRAHEQTRQRVVVLIDEYDNPLINTINDQEIHDRNLSLLKSIYSNLKDLDAHIKFSLLTGVTRFSKLTIFSGLNNLLDITLDKRYATICGITEDELKENFTEGIRTLGENEGWSYDDTLSGLKKYYDGYHFTSISPDIYNPFSIMCAMTQQEISNYWFSTGIPAFLVEKMKEGDTELEPFLNQKVEDVVLRDIDSARHSTLAALFQGGFLTIKGYEKIFNRYRLGVPNLEVKEGLSRLFLEYFLYPDAVKGTNFIFDMIKYAYDGEIDKFMISMQTFFAGVPFDLSKGSKEVYFHNAFYILTSLLGLKTKAEYHTSAGSIDLVIETEKYVYIFEFKLDGSVEQALAQIEQKRYARGFEDNHRKIYKIGANFSSEFRNLESWQIIS